MADPIDRIVEAKVEQLGFELVEIERGGSKSRPILRVRIDRPDSTAGHGVTLDDCRMVSRSIEAEMDEGGTLPARYVLEVSSPGVERPLVRARDFERFSGRQIAVHGREPLHGIAKRVEGELIGIEEEAGQQRIRLRTAEGIELRIPREQTKRVHLVYRWGEEV
jgi:ribosome maturation factor RimP